MYVHNIDKFVNTQSSVLSMLLSHAIPRGWALEFLEYNELLCCVVCFESQERVLILYKRQNYK